MSELFLSKASSSPMRVLKSSYSTTMLMLMLCAFLMASCGPGTEEELDTKFRLLSVQETGIDFENNVENTPEFNILNYLYFYDGAGVAAGDLNNNGLPDLFFVGNEVPNRLYKNLGDFRFEDISTSAGIKGDEGSWSTGVVMADVNGNGFLDIYVSRVNYLNKSGRNQLFINNGDLTFTERAAEFGLDFEGYSTQAGFFDYNGNGRLDLFLLNHSFHSERTYGDAQQLRRIPDPKAGDRLFRNDGDRFTDVTEEAGIISSALGYGLGLAIVDINLNGLPDIYVGNDFHEDDYLYINNGDGTFTESLYKYVQLTSNSSMGNDIADLTNDGYPDILSLDMMAEDHQTYMTSGGPDLYNIHTTKMSFGFGEKNERNTVQVNRGMAPDGYPFFKEMAFSLGLARTEWSWAGLLADFTNNGYKDVFVTNGIGRRPNDQDFVSQLRRIRQQDDPAKIERDEYRAIGLMPEAYVPNYSFANHGALQFENTSPEWGFHRNTVSGGAVYVDLNNNGFLDLVVSNINDRAHIFKNTAEHNDSTAWLRLKLEGTSHNTTGIGAKVFAYTRGEVIYVEQQPVRGFQSSVDHRLHLGLGSSASVDSLLIIWPDHRYQWQYDVEINRQMTLRQEDAGGRFDYSRLHRSTENAIWQEVTTTSGIEFRHQENVFNDFNREPLLPYKLSTQGPALATADITGNGLDDFFIGGAHFQASALYLQQSNGTFTRSQVSLFAQDRLAEDVYAHFFDATGNGLLDLYVMTGGSEESGTDERLLDRLYINEGGGQFKKSEGRLPTMYLNGAVVVSADFTGNGAADLFVGSRSTPWRYGHSPGSYLLANDGNGFFSNVTEDYYPEMVNIGMVTDAIWEDITGDGRPELIVVGEWMHPHVFRIADGRLENISEELGLNQLFGLWQSVHLSDITGNGYPDILLGNFGTNNRMYAGEDTRFELVRGDFFDLGHDSAIMGYHKNGRVLPFDRLDELLLEFPRFTQRISSYRDFASRTLPQLLGEEAYRNATKSHLNTLYSGVLLNNGSGNLQWKSFPVMGQTFPVMGISVLAGEENGNPHIFLTGNLKGVKPGTGGLQAAGHGLHLRFLSNESRFETLHIQESGLFVRGEMRSNLLLSGPGGTTRLLIGVNNDMPRLFNLVRLP
ncbi:MAG: VCBS repeat-containing protein [Balneolales bacterium]|nr:VCBS repeat-containing protein [Balneolales bacterium]